MDMPRTIRLRNGDKAWNSVSKDGCARRVKKLRVHMARPDIH
ncbi:hypothetical protein [Azohydromonas caseinilytica]|nr:hypothetical protein [Azohydromonas caseinilytica]